MPNTTITPNNNHHPSRVEAIKKLEALMAETSGHLEIGETDGVKTIKVKTLASDVTPAWHTPEPLEVATDAPLYPIEVLPPELRQWVQSISWNLQTPYDIAASMAKGAMATALQRAYEIHVTSDWSETTSLFVTAAARSGTNKTGIYRASERPLVQFCKEATKDALTVKAHWKAEKKRAETRLRTAETSKQYDQAEHEAAQLSLDEIVEREPHLPQLTTEDATTEELARLIAKQHGCIGILSDEGKLVYENIIGRYHKGPPKDDVLLKCYGGRYTINRRGFEGKGERHELQNIRISMSNSIQPEILQVILANEALMNSGFLFRFLLSCPESTLGFRDTTIREMPHAIQESYDAIGLRILRGAEPRNDNFLQFTLTSVARSRIQAYRADNEDLIRSEQYKVMDPWLSKAAGFALKIAAIMRAFRHPDAPHLEPLSGDEIDSAIVLTNYYREHFIRLIVKAKDKDGTPPAEVLLNWIKRKGHRSFKLRDAQMSIKQFREGTALVHALETLSEKGCIRRLGKAVEVNPAVFEEHREPPKTLPKMYKGDIVHVHERPEPDPGSGMSVDWENGCQGVRV